MVNNNDVVLPNGVLSETKILKRETLYQGIDGRLVERFYISPSQSYVFKPLAKDGQLAKEKWVYEHILHSFPPIYPKIIATSPTDGAEFEWIIFEDLGPLSHVYSEDTVLGVTRLMAWWQTLPKERLTNVSLKGPKPHIEDIVSEILVKKTEFMNLLPKLQISENIVQNIYFLIQKQKFSKSLVLSHGDLHLGNYAKTNNKIVVLDWEHTHLNTPLWDLYHMLDMSHPLFPKEVTSQFRKQTLEYYVEQIESFGIKINRHAFIQEYYLFSSAFSIWMILLIQGDLNRKDGKWPIDKLKVQLSETRSSLIQCASQLY